MIADRMSKIDASGIRKVFDLAAKLESPANLSIGQPDFDVPDPIKDAAITAIRKGKNKYTVTQGIPELIRKVRDVELAARDFEPDDVIITSGTSGGLLLAILVLVDPGDEVIIPDPYFVMYKHLVNLAGGVPVFVDTYPDFELRPERVRRAVTDKTKLLLLNSPSNPTGAVNLRKDLAEIAALAAGRGFVVLSDEIYDRFSYDGPAPSITEFLPETLLLGGFSKTYAMTGWRLGYAAGPGEIISQMKKLQQYTFVCAPSMAQSAGVVALDLDVSEYVDAYRRKRNTVYEALSGHFDVRKPRGAFYIFPKSPWGTGTQFVSAAIESNCLVIPGNVFSEKDTHFRISYATSDDDIARGVEILCKLADKPRV